MHKQINTETYYRKRLFSKIHNALEKNKVFVKIKCENACITTIIMILA